MTTGTCPCVHALRIRDVSFSVLVVERTGLLMTESSTVGLFGKNLNLALKFST